MKKTPTKMYDLVDERSTANKRLIVARIEAENREEARKRAWSRYTFWMERGARIVEEKPTKKKATDNQQSARRLP